MGWKPLKDVVRAVKNVFDPSQGETFTPGDGGGRQADRSVEQQRQYNLWLSRSKYSREKAIRSGGDMNLLSATDDKDYMNLAETEFGENRLKDDDFVNSLLSAYSTRGAELKSGRTQRKSSLGGGAQAGYSLLG